jgi:3-oxoadipate enol-lactonase
MRVPSAGPVDALARDVHWADNGGVSIAYELRGEDRPWMVLVHGLGYGRLGWGPFADRLAARRRLVLIDNRGIGESSRPRGPYRVEDLASDVLAVLSHLGIDRCDLLGASLGGMVALQMAADHPHLVRRLLLIAATPGDRQGAPLPEPTASLLQRDRERSLPPPRRLIEGALAPETVARRPGLVDQLLALREEQPQEAEAWHAQAAASASFSLRVPLADVEVPTLAVAGLSDTVIDPVNTMRVAFAMPRARALYLSPAGHLCFWEHPEVIADAALAFCADHGLQHDGLEHDGLEHGRDHALDHGHHGVDASADRTRTPIAKDPAGAERPA